jgi:hypothetical protein
VRYFRNKLSAGESFLSLQVDDILAKGLYLVNIIGHVVVGLKIESCQGGKGDVQSSRILHLTERNYLLDSLLWVAFKFDGAENDWLDG